MSTAVMVFSADGVFAEHRWGMNPHVDNQILRLAAERKIRLTQNDWRHIEVCRPCCDSLAAAIRLSDRRTKRDVPAARSGESSQALTEKRRMGCLSVSF